MSLLDLYFFFFSSRRRHTRCSRDWSSDVCSSDLVAEHGPGIARSDGRLPVGPYVDVEAKRAVRLNEGADRDAFTEVVVAIVALEQKRGPPDLAGAQPPILDRRHVVEGAELDSVGRRLAGAQLGA